jgi:hypothetical protein
MRKLRIGSNELYDCSFETRDKDIKKQHVESHSLKFYGLKTMNRESHKKVNTECTRSNVKPDKELKPKQKRWGKKPMTPSKTTDLQGGLPLNEFKITRSTTPYILLFRFRYRLLHYLESGSIFSHLFCLQFNTRDLFLFLFIFCVFVVTVDESFTVI